MTTSAAKIYERLMPIREPYIRRGKRVSALTVTSVFPGDREDNADNEQGQKDQADPFQSVGARGVRNMSARMMTTLLPSNAPFFNFITDEDLLDVLENELGVNRGEVELLLQKKSRTIHQAMVKSNLRTEAAEIFLSLIVDGNPLIYVKPNANLQVFRLDQFVLERDPSGKIMQIVIKETFDIRSLDKDIRKIVKEKDPKKTKKIDVYTHIKLDEEGHYTRHQEVCDEIIPESETSYPKGELPWIAPRLSKFAGEHYGRSYGEEFLGDLTSFEALSEALNDMAAASSRVLFMVAPGSMTNTDDLNGAPNGAFVTGRKEDIEPLLAMLQGDFGVCLQQAQGIEQRLAQAFLLMSSLQRDAERVTAQEIRLMAEELDNSLGGLYSLMSAEFQMPLVRAFVFRLKQGQDFTLPEDVEPNIVTGLEALGRGQDLNKLNGFMSQILEISQAGIDVSSFINATELVKRMAAGNGIDVNGLIKTEEDLRNEQMQAQQQQMMQGPVADTVSQAIKDQADPAKQAQLMKAQAATQEGN